jgi:hypothetical protein
MLTTARREKKEKKRKKRKKRKKWKKEKRTYRNVMGGCCALNPLFEEFRKK